MGTSFLDEERLKEVERQVEVAAGKFVHSRFMYIDIAGGLVEGMLLSQILYWFQPDSNGDSKIRVYINGDGWLVKKRSDWYEEIRITEKQYIRAISVLQQKGFVRVETHKFKGTPMTHIRPIDTNIQAAVKEWKDAAYEKYLSLSMGEQSIVTKGTNQNVPLVTINCDEKGVSTYTEITTKNITEITNNGSTPLSPQGETHTKSEWDFNKHSNVQNVNHLLAENKDPLIVHVAENGRLEEALLDWMEYKDERKPRNKNHYVEKSLIQQIKRFKTENDKYGVDKVIEVVNDSIASNYQGIVWDWLEKENFKKTAVNKKDQDRKEFDELMERWAKKK